MGEMLVLVVRVTEAQSTKQTVLHVALTVMVSISSHGARNCEDNKWGYNSESNGQTFAGTVSLAEVESYFAC